MRIWANVFTVVAGWLPATVIAATFTVNSTSDLVDIVPGDGTCEATPAGGDCTVRAAIMETNALPGGDVIEIPAGTYTLTIDGTDDIAAVGDLDIVSSEVTINGAGATATILDANGIDRYFQTSASTVSINDLTIQGGRTDADASVGGAIALNSAQINPNELSLTRVHLIDNGAKQGGAIRATPETVVRIEDSLIQSNITIEAGVGNRTGAAIYCQGCVMTIDASTITGNGDDLSGKVVVVDGNGSLDILNSTVSDNPFGGGIAASNGDVRIRFSTVVENGAQNLFFFSSGSHTLEVGRSILQNSTHDNCQFSASNVYTSTGYNVVSDATCAFSATGDVENTDAMLTALADNGGPTRTRAPLAASPAIDRVPPGACTDLDGVALGVDQRNDGRPAGANCDSGSVEVSEFILFEDGFEDLP